MIDVQYKLVLISGGTYYGEGVQRPLCNIKFTIQRVFKFPGDGLLLSLLVQMPDILNGNFRRGDILEQFQAVTLQTACS